ncbi:MAG: hypothetical protein MJA83_02495 [Gammaproteobacteria bacterium]|nr:hypothetical protein [Gammaproteobacteria bacterium]
MAYILRGKFALSGVLVILLSACGQQTQQPAHSLEAVAENYAKLVLALGEHDAGYVDAYYGPEEWQTEINNNPSSLADIAEQANTLMAELSAHPPAENADEINKLRHQYLEKQLGALAARVAMLNGETLRFDEETAALYDAVAPRHDAAYFQAILDEIDALLPGEQNLSERINGYRSRFVIPTDKLSDVFDAAIAACRERTLQHITLPENENFRIEYVNDKPWSGYNWYQGNAYSLIQINTDLPIFIDRAVDLGCHEGYPGHHTYNVLLEKHLVRDRGWVEFSVYALFSPQSLIAEGSANYGIDMAFPGDERLHFERDVLYPIAGLDADEAERYAELRKQLKKLNYAGNEAARAYLNNDMNREQAIEWLVTYALMSPERAAQRVDFIDTYRGYVINYNLGHDMVREYVERLSADQDDDVRWEAFGRLLASPRLPSGLK